MNTVILQTFGAWWRFAQPLEVVIARQPGEVMAALLAVETAVTHHNLYAAGFLSYEASAAFGLACHSSQPHDPPLLWFGLYRQPQVIAPPQPPTAANYRLGDWQASVTESQYHDAIKRIKAYIAAGHTYQVNYTFPLHADFSGDAWALFAQLSQAQQAAYTAYVDMGSHAICSASPELFFTLDGAELCSKPMKGTAVRGHTLSEDKANIAWLHQSPKNRAENVMIVDMIRNDMGRIADIGSVAVPRLFEVERYPTVLQMTSTVTARSRASFSEIIAAMFPCASITGAPKHRTMQIIQELEAGPRGVYTGAIGVLAPDRRAQFNVAIRTVTVDRQRGRAVYGVGGGIVWDSQAAEEWAECAAKSEVLRRQRPSFHLLETLRCTPDGGCDLLNEHLARLADSAEYFGFAADLPAIRHRLAQLAASLTGPAKVRLLLAEDGAITLETAPLPETAVQPRRVALAAAPVDSSNIWLYHKTTRREVYAAAHAACPHCDDVLLWNERGELTEATIANVVLELDGELVTPPIEAGLLAGTLRGVLVGNGRIHERPIPLKHLRRASKIWLINSVRGWQEAQLVKISD
ncbi:MAG: aminodeoxychorismate synthase component I [Ardenticatenaceae bacterium]|nr:aminodeoxychorismate synthase component I [Ardenticatenaceae bacterium]MCB8990948.1 aminodeoxychorismate synthase component I [Ardenticatenaceae bacterium]MCB9004401.1 aminodeoxychorismate synthase component I [Ardenticatenaceae bacterium]